MVLSILHRATGLVLSVALIGLVGWLVAAAAGPDAYAAAHAFFTSAPGALLMAGATFAFFYHLCNGIRHLVWDAGYLLDIPGVYASGWAVVAASVVLTVLTWLMGFGVLGGST
jgi:succinate dehydrogenase / fumarate reductase cytochrome b subunit